MNRGLTPRIRCKKDLGRWKGDFERKILITETTVICNLCCFNETWGNYRKTANTWVTPNWMKRQIFESIVDPEPRLEAKIYKIWIVNITSTINGNHLFMNKSLLHLRLFHFAIDLYYSNVSPDVSKMSTNVIDWIFTIELHRILRISSFEI